MAQPAVCLRNIQRMLRMGVKSALIKNQMDRGRSTTERLALSGRSPYRTISRTAWATFAASGAMKASSSVA